MQFFNKKIQSIYKYLYIHDNQTILLKDMERDLNITRKTIAKHIKWLEKRGLIKKNGKHYNILPLNTDD